MAGLPTIILFGFSSLIWILKKRHIRISWILTFTSFFLAWIVTIVLTQFIPAGLTVSLWEPQSFFGSGLRIELEPLSNVLVNATLTLGLVITFTFEGRQDSIRQKDLFSLCLLGSFGLLTIISGSFITFCLSWTLWEIAIIFVYAIDDDSNSASGATQKRTLQRLSSVPLTLAIGVILSKGGKGTEVMSAQIRNWTFLLGIIVVFVRIDLHRNLTSYWKGSSQSRSREIWIQGISVASGFALLGQILKYGSPQGLNPLFVGIGIVLSLIGLLRLLVMTDLGSNVSSTALTLLGVGVLIEPAVSESNGGIFLLISSIMLLAFSSMIVPDDKHKWRLAAALAAGSIVIGIPGSIGGDVVNAVVEALLSKDGLFIGCISVISLFAVALDLVRYPATKSWDNSPNQASYNLSAISGTSLLLLSAMIMGLLNGTTLSTGSVGAFFTSAVLLGGITYTIIRRGECFDVSIPLSLPQGSVDALKSVWTGFSTIISSMFQTTARVFEGRAGILWVYVIVQLVLVAIGISE